LKVQEKLAPFPSFQDSPWGNNTEFNLGLSKVIVSRGGGTCKPSIRRQRQEDHKFQATWATYGDPVK
jgi:hypothetical protein